MKKLLLFSDSHGDKLSVNKLFARIDEYDKIVFAGDGVDDIADYLYAYPQKMVAVRGNCDPSNCLPDHSTILYSNAKILVTHGNRYMAKYGIDSLLTAALNEGANAVLYGHTHRPKVDYVNGITLVNGGTLSSRGGNTPSYAEIEIAGGNIFAKIVKMD